MAVGLAAAARPTVVPAKLVGRWTRNVTQHDWDKHGQGAQSFPVGFWSLVIKRNGDVNVYVPGGTSPDFATSFSASPDGRLTVHAVPICVPNGQYRWKVTGNLLTITKVADKLCPARIALYAGVWKRK